MLAIHPVTGKEVRVIQTDASLTKSSKTLAFWCSREIDRPPAVWDCLGGSKTSGPEYTLLTQNLISASDLQEASGSRLTFVKKGSLTITAEEFRGLGLSNCLMLEELHLLYPQLGDAWDGTDADAVMMIAGLLRMHAVYGIWSQKRGEALGLRHETEKPLRLWWVTQFYVPDKAKRRRELEKALELNLKSPLIDRVVLLNEKEEALPKSEKLVEIPIGHRLTYADVMKFAITAPDDVVIAFANADIAIDSQSWKGLWTVDLEDKFLALLRYDVPASGAVHEAQIFGPRADSQDCWVVRAVDVKKRAEKLCGPALEFRFGQMGCDNAIALEMLRQKFLVSNPAQNLKTFHFHSSEIRNYSKTDVIDRPIFHYVQPTGIHDLEPKMKFPLTTPSTLLRPLRGPAASKVATKDLKTGSTNPLTLFPEVIVDLSQNCFMTPSGLVYDAKAMYVGPAAKALEAWSKSEVSGLLPAVECKRVCAVPWPDQFDGSREDFLVRFLSKVLRLKQGESERSDSSHSVHSTASSLRDSAEFYCPDSKDILDALQVFRWPGNHQPVIKHELDGQVWCREAKVLLPSDNTVPLAEDMEALRSSVVSWAPSASVEKPKIVLVEEETSQSARLCMELETVLETTFDVRVVYPGRTSSERMVDMLRGAWGIVVGSGDRKRCGWNWVLPRGARVFQMVSKGSELFGLEMSAACGLEHRFVDATKESVLEEVRSELEVSRLAAAAPVGSTDVPTIWVPRRDLEGYFGHPGDSFREMVRLWAKAGKVRVQEHPTATMVWWNSVGTDGVLLYDRPNHDWRMAAPAEEKVWKFALFGNPKPAANKPGAPWFFWPRRPEFVEKLVVDGVAQKGYGDRSERLVFYGKIENAVQKKRRSTADWSSACSIFAMASPDEPHKFSQLEYLQELAKARFGLCLAGYGLKCHREIECMALGVVPVCARDVDMDSYAEPPVEGVHYLRASTPEEAKQITEAMSEADWYAMSKAAHEWWKRTCSVEGSFSLTEKLIATAN